MQPEADFGQLGEIQKMPHSRKALLGAVFVSLSALLAACDGDDGSNGADGAPGSSGNDGLNSLIRQTELSAGNANCPGGGTRIESGVDSDGDGELDDGEVMDTSYVCVASTDQNFNRIAVLPVCLQDDANCDSDDGTAAEIVAASTDGRTLIYSDSPGERIGFVDISNPEAPLAIGTLDLAGEPTSVAVSGPYVLVGVNTSADFMNVSGELDVVDIATQTIVRTIDVGGQPDSVAVSPDGAYAAVVIENERDEDLGDGAPPQLPAGNLVIVDLVGSPAGWTTRTVSMAGIADLYAADPEPEYVDINERNIAVVSLQENNHIVLVDLSDGSIVNDFSAGTVDLDQIDTTEEEPALVSQTESLSGIPREPDGVTWISDELFVTANEGDLDGGSRGFTVFNTAGELVFESGNALEHIVARIGHYPDARSKNKGNEPENAEFGRYGNNNFLFVASERSSVIFVYDVADPVNPVYKQVLPAGLGPEGVLAIPSRKLLIAASEEDSRDDKFRSVVNIYRYELAYPAYPTIASADREDGTPIAWSAMSGLAADPLDANTLYAIEDSFYQRNRIFGLDVGTVPARLTSEMRISDAGDVFAAIDTVALADTSVDDDDATRVSVFDEADLAALINDDKTVNIDPEGIAVASDGGFWIASEGAGTIGDEGRPINSLNFLFKTDPSGVIEQVITLPDEVNAKQIRFGFEGVAEYNGSVYVAFQRVWAGDDNVRLGVYDTVAQTWSFLYYELDAVESQFGGWVGLSDLSSLGDGRFLVVERDNQGGPDAAIKRLYSIDVTGLAADSLVSKTLVRDLMPDLVAVGGPVPEKIEGSAVTLDGKVYIVNDNDGVDDNNGETELLNLGAILD